MLHFAAGGLYDGLSLLRDDETGSYWHHIRGEAMFGSSVGAKMDVRSIQMMSKKEVLEQKPDALLAFSDMKSSQKAFAKGMGDSYREIDSYPPGFKKTMGAIDQRLPEHTSGLGVIVAGQARFYPFSELEDRQTDQWGEDRSSPPMGGENGQPRKGPLIKAPILLIQWGEGQEAPMAVWEDGAVPVQLLTRWYGFSYSYPDCEIYQAEED